MERPEPIEVRVPITEVLDWELYKERLSWALVDYAFNLHNGLPFGEEWDETAHAEKIEVQGQDFLITLVPE